jgi:DNA-binding MarR family transcriptional regulator
MGEVLKQRLRQSKFEHPQQEAVLSLLVAANAINERLDRICGEFDISRQQYNILRILKGAKGEGYQCGDIAGRMLDRAPDITRRIDNLEKQGFAERTRSDVDRRVVITRITDKGLELLDRMNDRIQEFHDIIRQRLTKQECADLTALCEKLIDAGD